MTQHLKRNRLTVIMLVTCKEVAASVAEAETVGVVVSGAVALEFASKSLND